METGPAYQVEVSDNGRENLKVSRKQNKENHEDVVVAETATDESSKQLKNPQQKQAEWRVAREISRLQQVQRSVQSHEMAHMTAGGAMAGGITYRYAPGPDGKMYVVGGEVQISAKEGRTPEETIRNMQAVQRAAMAPADPSPQDLSTAAAASLIEQRARRLLWQQRAEQAMPEDKKAPPSLFRKTAAMPTSIEGLINMMFPGTSISLRGGQQPGVDLTAV
jgi:hypothetical protein